MQLIWDHHSAIHQSANLWPTKVLSNLAMMKAKAIPKYLASDDCLEILKLSDGDARCCYCCCFGLVFPSLCVASNEPSRVFSFHQIWQIYGHRCHNWMVSLQCEFECALSGDLIARRISCKFYIGKVFDPCEFEYGVWVHQTLRSDDHSFQLDKHLWLKKNDNINNCEEMKMIPKYD